MRVSEHNNGKHLDAWTSKRLPATLVWAGEFQRIVDMIDFERWVKVWRRAKKEAVIRGEGGAPVPAV